MHVATDMFQKLNKAFFEILIFPTFWGFKNFAIFEIFEQFFGIRSPITSKKIKISEKA